MCSHTRKGSPRGEVGVGGLWEYSVHVVVGALDRALIRIDGPSMPQFTPMQSYISISTASYALSRRLFPFQQQETHGNAALELRLAVA
jgi:hypothetical protein